LSAGAHRDTNTHTQATLKTQANTCQVIIVIQHQNFHSSTHLSTQPQETHTHPSDESPAKTPGGRADNWFSDNSILLYREEKQRIRPPAVRCTQKNKHTRIKYINTQTHRYSNKQTSIRVCLCMHVCMRRERISVTLVTTAAQGCASDLCICALRACVCWYYFANLSTVSVCLPVHTVRQTHTHTQASLKSQANTCQVRM
jgi:hypothetical protein